MLPYPHSPGHYMTLCHCHSHNPTTIVTINALGKSNSIQNLKITNLHGHLLFDSMDPALLAGVDDNNDNDTSLAECQYPLLTMMMMTQTQNPITIQLTPMRLMTIQAKHLHTALEAKNQFTT